MAPEPFPSTRARRLLLPFLTLGLLLFCLDCRPAVEGSSRLGLQPAQASLPRATRSGFQVRSLRIGDEEYTYQVFVPSQWKAEQEWPVIFFLHGAGERGADGKAQTTVGLPSLLSLDFPAVVVMPQCRRGTWWGSEAMEKQAFMALEKSIEEFNGDPDRIYLTGLSMGGYGTWAFGYKYPTKFAALVPGCGGVKAIGPMTPPEWHPATQADPYLETARAISHIPVWAFHGSQDRLVPASESRRLVQALRQVGGEVQYTEYEGVGHNSWDRAYSEDDLIPWLLKQTR